MRPCVLVLPILLWLAAAAPEPSSAGPEESAPGCRHWAVLLPEDAGQLRIYDGIRKGLEVAQLERLCLKDLPDTDEAFRAFVAEHAALPEPRPLVFLVGRRVGDRVLAAGFRGPGVYVSTEWTVAGAPLREEPLLPAGVARVRAELPAETLGSVLRVALGREEISAVLSGEAPPGMWAPLTRLRAAARLSAPGDSGDPDTLADVQLHLRMASQAAIGFTPASPRPARGRCRVSDDVADFGTGAAIVLVPDHERLGRTAAEAGRRLWRSEPVAEALVVHGAQVLVDLDACDAQGIRPPLTFLAGVDGLKGRRTPAAPADPGR